MRTPTLVHPNLLDPCTGEPMAALGVTKAGRPIWPVLGGAPLDSTGTTGTLVERRNAVLTEARAWLADPACTAEQLEKAKTGLDQVRAMDTQIKASDEADVLMGKLGAVTPNPDGSDPRNGDALTLGDHFAKNGAARLKAVRGLAGATVGVPEWSPSSKAASDPQLVAGSLPLGLAVPGYDTTVVRALRRTTIDDLLGLGTMSGNSLTYFVEGAAEGAFTAVAEGAQKPQLHYLYTTVTDTLSKIAGFIKLSDEMVEDVPFLVSEINERLLYDLSIVREAQYINGSGVAPNLKGIALRSGIQTETQAVSPDTMEAAIFRAATKVFTATGFVADGVVINPVDYQSLRLQKDLNGQYTAGGPFAGQYGVGTTPGVVENAPIWGLRTVVTPATPLHTVWVAAWRQGATRYPKGGVRVDSTNSNVNDFEKNLITIRAEQRLGLAVRVPTAFCKVTTL